MADQHFASISCLLAQATPVLPAETAVGPSPVVFWTATLLVAAGITIIGVVFATKLRGRKAVDEDVATEYVPARQPPVAAAPERIERAPIAKTAPLPPAQPTPTTIEAQNLLRLMGEAEELCTRLGRELDDKAQRIERLLARAEGRLGSESAPQTPVPPAPPGVRAPMYAQSQPAPAPAIAASGPPASIQAPAIIPGYHAPTSPPRPEIVTRPVGIPSPISAVAYTGPSPYYNSTPLATQPVPQPVQTRMASPAAPQAPAAPLQDPFGIDPLTRDIYTLADAGHSAQAIAQQLGQHTGKVELILALRPG